MSVVSSLLSPVGKHTASIVSTPYGSQGVILDGRQLITGQGSITNLQFSPDGQHLAFTAHEKVPGGAQRTPGTFFLLRIAARPLFSFPGAWPMLYWFGGKARFPFPYLNRLWPRKQQVAPCWRFPWLNPIRQSPDPAPAAHRPAPLCPSLSGGTGGTGRSFKRSFRPSIWITAALLSRLSPPTARDWHLLSRRPSRAIPS